MDGLVNAVGGFIGKLFRRTDPAQRRRELASERLKRRRLEVQNKRKKLNQMQREEESSEKETKRKSLRVKDRLREALQSGPQVAIHLNYVDDMSRVENWSVAKQIKGAYSANKRIQEPFGLHVCPFVGPTAESLKKHQLEGWVMDRHDEDLLDVFEKDKLIYLSPDSENVIDCIEDDKVYVIGGIADKTVKKGLTLNYANTHGIRHARLPLKEHCDNVHQPALNVDVVVQILAKFKANKNWKRTFEESLPKRSLIRKSNETRKVRRSKPQSVRSKFIDSSNPSAPKSNLPKSKNIDQLPEFPEVPSKLEKVENEGKMEVDEILEVQSESIEESKIVKSSAEDSLEVPDEKEGTIGLQILPSNSNC
eukprot:TRINITY_DN79039_c0_g1_i1.p1 TRINITY_DN79039_c0_g1~~TRINITY_DN79039_c0_g1_i1.p1  ORF type:complete len:365 (-),score=104.26 TRINITY_DN79039_c0_g1_i1:73-1167(-)